MTTPTPEAVAMENEIESIVASCHCGQDDPPSPCDGWLQHRLCDALIPALCRWATFALTEQAREIERLRVALNEKADAAVAADFASLQHLIDDKEQATWEAAARIAEVEGKRAAAPPGVPLPEAIYYDTVRQVAENLARILRARAAAQGEKND